MDTTSSGAPSILATGTARSLANGASGAAGLLGGILGRGKSSSGSSRQSGGLLGGSEWVVPRGECQYRQHDFSQLPARRRRAAARLAVPRFEPAPGARVHIAWQQGIAHYWIWMPGEDGVSLWAVSDLDFALDTFTAARG